MEKRHNDPIVLLRRISVMLLLCFLSFKTTTYAQTTPSTATLEAMLSKETDIKKRKEIYIKIIDQTYTNSKLSDKYRELFLDDALKSGNQSVILNACEEICSSYKYELIKKAINATQNLSLSKEQKSNITLLKCHAFWNEANMMSRGQREAELSKILTTIYKTPKWNDRFDEYLTNFKAYRLHGEVVMGTPVEPYVMQMYRIANSINPDGVLAHHASQLAADVFIRTSQYQQAETMNNNLIRIQKLQEEALKKKKRNRPYDITDYTTTIRMLVCNFEQEHKVDSTLMQKILPYGWMKHSYNNMKNEKVLQLYPLYLALYENRIEDAARQADSLEDRISKGKYALDYEHDAAVTAYWKANQQDKAIEVTNKQITNYTHIINNIDELYREEMGLNAQKEEFDRKNKILQSEKDINDRNTEHSRNELHKIIRQHYQDSLNYSKVRKKKLESLKKEETLNETTSQQAKEEKENISHNIVIFSLIFISVIVAMLIMLIPYIIRIRKINKHLAKEHERLIKITDKANQSNRLKVFFLQNTSHDIRSPLGAIDSLSQMMYDMVASSNQDEDIKECASMVSQNSVVLTRLMNNILDISAIESGRYPIVWEDTYPIGIANEIMSAMNVKKNKPIEVEIETELPDDFMLRSDGKRLRQLMRSLLHNAWKFTDKGYIIARMSVSDGKFILIVEDTGRGIPKEYAIKIFQRFFKIDEFVPGTGMGLSLCKVIAENLQSTLEVDNDYTEGARFVFEHPIDAEHISKQNLQETNKDEKQKGGRMKSIALTLMLFVSSCLTLGAQTIHEVFDSLRAELPTISNDNERKLLVLTNLLDISSAQHVNFVSGYAEQLYELGKTLKRDDIMLEACRNNLSPDNINKITQRINSIGDSQDKRCSKAFINAFNGEFETNRMTNDEKKAYLYNYINEFERLSLTDPYERYVRLIRICHTAIGIEQSQVIKNYVSELIELAEKLDNGKGYLRTNVYQIAYRSYMNFNEPEKVKVCLQKLFTTLEKMQEDYQKAGRKYRTYDRFKLGYYTDLYFCLTENEEREKAQCYKEIKRIMDEVEKTSNFGQIGNVMTKANLVIAFHEGRMQDAAVSADKFVNEIDRMLYQSNSTLFGEDLSSSHFELISKVYQQTGNKDQLLKTRILLCEQLRRTINNMKKYNFLHLNINLQIMDAKLEQARILAENERRQLESLQLQTEIERNQLNNDREKQNQFLESIRIDSLTEANKVHQQVMNQQVEESQGKISLIRLIMLLAASIVLLTSLIATAIIANRLRRRRSVLSMIKKKLSSELERARQSDKETTAFLKSIRHEVGTPLNVIMGMSKQIAFMVKEQDSEELKMMSNMINENGEQLLSLINDILNLSLIQSGEYNINVEWQNITTLCEAVRSSVQHHCPPNVTLSARYDIDPQTSFKTDSVRFKQVLTNLFTNACKYTDSGSITLIVSKTDKMYEFAVEDTGCGIKPENAKIIFERFEKLGSKKQGTGLGLNISRAIALKLRGNLVLDTNYTKGARFVFTHPIMLTK